MKHFSSEGGKAAVIVGCGFLALVVGGTAWEASAQRQADARAEARLHEAVKGAARLEDVRKLLWDCRLTCNSPTYSYATVADDTLLGSLTGATVPYYGKGHLVWHTRHHSDVYVFWDERGRVTQVQPAVLAE